MTGDEAIAALDASSDLLLNPKMQDALASVVDDYMAQVAESFAGAHGPDGEPWDDIVYRATPPPPLRLTSALYDSVLSDAQSATLGDTKLETDGAQLVDYAVQQDEGLDYGYSHYVGWVSKYATVYRRYISWHPGRPFMGFGDETLELAVDHGIDLLNEQLMDAWS